MIQVETFLLAHFFRALLEESSKGLLKVLLCLQIFLLLQFRLSEHDQLLGRQAQLLGYLGLHKSFFLELIGMLLDNRGLTL